jgi:hypothetical protein
MNLPDWQAELQRMLDIPIDYEAIYGHPLPADWASWDDYIMNSPTQGRKAEQLLTGQEP